MKNRTNFLVLNQTTSQTREVLIRCVQTTALNQLWLANLPEQVRHPIIRAQDPRIIILKNKTLRISSIMPKILMPHQDPIMESHFSTQRNQNAQNTTRPTLPTKNLGSGRRARTWSLTRSREKQSNALSATSPILFSRPWNDQTQKLLVSHLIPKPRDSIF